MFHLKPTTATVKPTSMEGQNLGRLDIKWLNYFGDPGHLKLPDIRSAYKKLEIEIQPVHPIHLVMECSSPVTFRIHNNGRRNVSLHIDLYDE